MQFFVRRLLHRSPHVVGEGLLSFHATRDVIDRRLEPVRGIVAVEAGDGASFFVQEKNGRSELHAHQPRKLFFADHFTVKHGHLAVAPDIECDRDEVAARLADDERLGEVGLHQRLAIWTAVLPEVEKEALSFLRCLAYVLAEIEQALAEPSRDVDGMRTCRLRKGCEWHKQRGGERKQAVPHIRDPCPTLAERRKRLPQFRASNRRPIDRDFVRSIFTRDHPGTSDLTLVEATR